MAIKMTKLMNSAGNGMSDKISLYSCL